MNFLISFFAGRHLLANMIFIGVILLGAFIWQTIGKEELPEFESSRVRVSASYPGAPAEDVELFVTKPIEDELKGVVGIEDVISSSSLGSCTLNIILDENYPDKKEVVQNIQDAVLRAKLPSEVRDLPTIRHFKSAEKAILDIGIYHKDVSRLDTKMRTQLQQFVLSLENQLMALKEISSVSRSHYRKPELQILVDPKKILAKQISLSQIKSQIEENHVRTPVGSLLDRGESRITALNELETVATFNDLVLRGNYDGYGVKLSDITADIRNGFERTNSIMKINGHEGVFLEVKKTVSTDILTAHKTVVDFIKKFKAANKEAPISIVMMDDESYAVRNRISLITYNALIGFVLIALVLFLFLEAKAGFWVAMGIPFSVGFTLISASLLGYTVNNMTLAGIIIVLGIVVDDAIIIAENISRHREEGMNRQRASVFGTSEVVKPIVASVVTTCVAFVPLIFFEGFFGKLVYYIPFIVILMLLGSLFESIFILPSHMAGRTLLLESVQEKEHWFHRVEASYRRFLGTIFKFRWSVIFFFLALLLGAMLLFKYQMKFVMFPREESTEAFIKVTTEKGMTREETAKIVEPLENYLASDQANIVGVRSSIGLSRRGGEVHENEASILVEVYPADERDLSLKKLIKRWEDYSNTLSGFASIKFQTGRWGHDSGNAIEVQIQENDDQKRKEIAEFLRSKMSEMKELIDVEVEEPLMKKEFLLQLDQESLVRHDVSAARITNVLRTFVEGSILYSLNKGEEEVDVRLSVPEEAKNNLDELLNLRVDNSSGSLIYLRKVVKIKEIVRPINIGRTNYKRTSMVYANMSPTADSTPLLAADKIEQVLFPQVYAHYPSSILSFTGEVKDTREGQGEFSNSIIIVIISIYLILAIMFNSLSRPFFVLSIVPFGVAGAVYVLFLHGMSVYGFFAAVGALGMVGVVVNDAIVMIDKIDRCIEQNDDHPWETIARVAATRLRPVLLTTLTTVIGILPTAYGLAGYDSMLAEMMITMGWGLAFGTFITLILIPTIYTFAGSAKATSK